MPEQKDDLPSLEALERKIEQAKPKEDDEQKDLGASDYSQAFRFTVELTAGVVVGTLVGYGIDTWLGTLPWAMIVCLFLGMGAGIRNMVRASQEEESKTSE